MADNFYPINVPSESMSVRFIFQFVKIKVPVEKVFRKGDFHLSRINVKKIIPTWLKFEK